MGQTYSELRTPRKMASIGLVIAMCAMSAPAASAAKDGCKASNATTGKSYRSNLQGAIDVAGSGDTIEVRGRCVGNFTVAKQLTLVGIVKGASRAALDAAGTGRPLTVASTGIVTLTSLLITGGNTGANGGGVFNSGTLVLNGASSVNGNVSGALGGGIANCSGCAVTLNDSSTVDGNIALRGGGIYTVGSLSLNDSSSVVGNWSLDDGGGIYNILGAVTMSGASLVGANEAGNDGGGIYNTGGSFTMTASSSVTGNRADVDDDGVGTGGGVFGCLGSLIGVVDGGNVNDNYRGSTGLTESNVAVGC